MPKFIFQSGLKFECDYMSFFSPFEPGFSAGFLPGFTNRAGNFSPRRDSLHFFLKGFVQEAAG